MGASRLGLVSVLMLAPVAHATVVIDDFSVAPMTRGTAAPGSTSASGLSSSSVIGGVRELTYGGRRSVAAIPPGSVTTLTVDTSSGGSFIVDGVPNSSPINSGLEYDGNAAGASTMNIDLAPNGEAGLAIDFAYTNFSPDDGNFDISLTSTGGSFGRFVRVPSSLTPFRLFVPFPQAFDPRNVTRIAIGTGNGYWFNDFAIANISSEVPEPRGLTLLVLASIRRLTGRTRS